jgi:outer membrane receptor protein involved in Fe transport
LQRVAFTRPTVVHRLSRKQQEFPMRIELAVSSRSIRRPSLALAVLAVLAASSAAAQGSAPADAELEEIVVFGRGETRQVQSVTTAQLEQLTPGTSPLKAVEKLPGVNFQSADPYGAYEWSARIKVRGFDQNQMGFTLDGVPLGDMSYGNHNGLHISRAIASENVGAVALSQGSGAIDTASTSNLGGTLEFTSMDPSRESRPWSSPDGRQRQHAACARPVRERRVGRRHALARELYQPGGRQVEGRRRPGAGTDQLQGRAAAR